MPSARSPAPARVAPRSPSLVASYIRGVGRDGGRRIDEYRRRPSGARAPRSPEASHAKAVSSFARRTKEHGLQRRMKGPPFDADDRCVVVEECRHDRPSSTLAAIRARCTRSGNTICGVVKRAPTRWRAARASSARGRAVVRAEQDRRRVLPTAPIAARPERFVDRHRTIAALRRRRRREQLVERCFASHRPTRASARLSPRRSASLREAHVRRAPGAPICVAGTNATARRPLRAVLSLVSRSFSG